MNPSSSSESGLTLRDRFKTATRDAILEAAATAFARDGGPHPRMEDIAARAGIAVGTLYNYFHDRSALVEALLERRRGHLLSGLDAAVSGGEPFADRLARFVQTLADHFETNRHLLSVLLDEERSRGQTARTASRRQSMLQELHVRAERLLAEGVRAHALREADPAVYAGLLVGMVRGTVMMRALTRAGVPLSDSGPEIVRVFLQGASR